MIVVQLPNESWGAGPRYSTPCRARGPSADSVIQFRGRVVRGLCEEIENDLL